MHLKIERTLLCSLNDRKTSWTGLEVCFLESVEDAQNEYRLVCEESGDRQIFAY